MIPQMFSDVAVSNLFTMGLVASIDPRRALPPVYMIPSYETRMLRARLILEEALETIEALGFKVTGSEQFPESIGVSTLEMDQTKPDLMKIIDGCCDLEYVSKGTMLACGAPDLPHLKEVCRANDAKFPDCKPILDAHGKFQKPKGWQGPLHEAVMRRMQNLMQMNNWNCAAISEKIINDKRLTIGGEIV